MNKKDLEGIKEANDFAELEAKHNIVTLGFFWSTIGFDKTINVSECRKVYDLRTKKRDCDFARTLLLLDKEPKGSALWKLLLKNARMHLTEEKKELKK